MCKNGIVVLAVAMSTAACASSAGHQVGHVKTVSADVRDILKNQFPDVAPATIDELTLIDGFNDQQPLAGDGSDDTGPVASLYIVPKRYDDAEFMDTWRLTSVLEVEGSAAMPNAYKNILRIKDNPVTAQYCIYLRKRSAGNRWEASAAPVVAKKCLSADDGDKINQVAEETEPATSKSDFPSVVRFDQDQNGKVVIGVTCGKKVWCEIGRSGNRRDPIHNTLAVQTKKHRIKPWHDEQEITTDKAPPYKRAIRASVTPDENLGAYTILDFTEIDGAASAYVFMDADPAPGTKYEKWGLKKGNNTVTLFAKADPANLGRYIWSATFTPEGGTGNGKHFRVESTPHTLKPPAVARWKWYPQDEDLWVACEQGCCTVGGFES